MTDLRNVFARDEQGNIKRKQPCQTPGCGYPNWHICLVGKPDTTIQLLKERRKISPRSEAHRDAHAASMRERWDRENGERDRKMVQYYKDNPVGYKGVAEAFNVAPSTAYKALKKAEAEGRLVMRKPGQTLAKGAK